MLIDWYTVGAQIVNFLLLVWLLKRFLYKPILNALDARETQIEAKLLGAQKIKSEAVQKNKELDEKLLDIENKREASLNKMQDDVRAEKERLKSEVDLSVEAYARKKNDNFKDKEKELSRIIIQKVQDEVFYLSKKVLYELAEVDLEAQIVKLFIKKLNEMNEDEKIEMRNKYTSSFEDENVAILRSSKKINEKHTNEILKALGEFFDYELEIEFDVKESLISGIEFIIKGQKIAWSINNYLESLESNVQKLFLLKKYDL